MIKQTARNAVEAVRIAVWLVMLAFGMFLGAFIICAVVIAVLFVALVII